ncbi:MAG: T9SS type A sorting domain-containing protein, partial [Sphingobacteriaceae bacterium]|nr:T9SS type A sorting domain-containing protein [Sphingobacteriaceae bacterium]MDP2188085.1 T9SS type A sorting domain-containing protein [Sphingobacteriaceae bacterium]
RKVYPVPADQFVNFDFGAQQGSGALELRDNLGRLVYSMPIDLSTGSKHEVKTGNLAAGVYNYRFVMNDKVQYGQVVVRR